MVTLRSLWVLVLGVVLGFGLASVKYFERPSEILDSVKVNNASTVTATPVAASSTAGDVAAVGATTQNLRGERAVVARVVDGDTIELVGGERVRYVGIDTPETVDPRKPVMCFGHEASAKNKELVEGKEVRLVRDITDRDKYGRLLRYVYVGDLFVNDALVRQGYAHAYTYPPDVAMNERFLAAEREARAAGRGLWSACRSTTTEVKPPTVQVGTNGCSIKGNISASGAKIYHLPGQSYYAKTQIDESKGEKWFCSEEEAQSAGWRKSKT